MKTTGCLLLALASSARAFTPLRTPALHRVPSLLVRHVSSRHNENRLFEDGGMEDNPVLDVIHIHDLLLQRAIQTQLCYLQEFHNDFKASWLSKFLDHEHLDSGTRWHAVCGLKVPMTDYLREMLRAPSETVEIEVVVGSNNVGGEISDAWSVTTVNEEEDTFETEEDKSLEKDLKPWLAASNCRKRNPYLNKEPKKIIYDETVEPRLVATQLMSVVSHLSREWKEDLMLQFLADDPEHIEEARLAEGMAHDNRDQGDLRTPPTFDSAERSRTGSSPLRRSNFDLIERVVTIQAVRSLEAELAFNSVDSKQADMELTWLDTYMKGWWARLSGAVRTSSLKALETASIVDSMLEEMEMQPAVVDGEYKASPRALAGRIHEHRQHVELKLMAQLTDTESILESIRREDAAFQLEKTLLETDRAMLEMVISDGITHHAKEDEEDQITSTNLIKMLVDGSEEDQLADEGKEEAVADESEEDQLADEEEEEAAVDESEEDQLADEEDEEVVVDESEEDQLADEEEEEAVVDESEKDQLADEEEEAVVDEEEEEAVADESEEDQLADEEEEEAAVDESEDDQLADEEGEEAVVDDESEEDQLADEEDEEVVVDESEEDQLADEEEEEAVVDESEEDQLVEANEDEQQP